MKINRLTVSNLSSFEGKSTFDFSVTDQSKNIILIGGKNGAGKSSLFLAMKLALYGPMAYRYQGINPIYISKIKELINHNTFTKSEVKAYTEIGISLYENRNFVDYRIKRTWQLVNKKLQETIEVYKDNRLMKFEEEVFFQEYLNTVLPVNLFNLYFFDGEKIDEMFEGVKYNNFIKRSLLTLYSVDVFEVLRKHFDNYIVKTKGDKELENTQIEFSNIVEELEERETRINDLVVDVDKIRKKIETTEVELLNAREIFHRAGGLTELEKNNITKVLFENEKIKNENNLKVKNFVEDLMPFVICGEYGETIKAQLEREDELKRFKLLSENITAELTKEVIKESISELKITFNDINKVSILSDLVHKKVLDNLKPNRDSNTIHDLSTDQRDRVVSTINRIYDFEKGSIIENINDKQKALKKTKSLNKKLRNSLNESEVVSYMNNINDLENNILNLKREYEAKEIECDECKIQIEKLEIEKHKIKEIIKSKVQLSNVYDLSEKLSQMMSTLVKEVSRSKFNELEDAFLIIFKKIMRKDNIIDYIKIDNDFNLNLYQEQTYTISEIKLLIENIGFEKFIDRIGEKGKKILNEKLIVENNNMLKIKIDSCDKNMSIKLYKKIGLSQLSKGEKQIFTLSLYWAMINIVNHEIPFIIDTPYARIDTQHRDQITSEYFTTIGNQVIILSTDEEINEHYYKLMKKNIAHEYLLLNENDDNKTIVKEEYFFKDEKYDI